jgi:signal transduction histidine kinase
VGNALKFTIHGFVIIEVRIEQVVIKESNTVEKYLKISVIDSGIGINQAD